MLENMFIGRPPGNYDRLLDFSRAVTGGLFFVPAASLLDSLAARAPAAAPEASPKAPANASAPSTLLPAQDGTLPIGSLKGSPQ